MYNLVALVEQMAANLDAAKKDSLLRVKVAASKAADPIGIGPNT
ncbi:hypothetical protein AZE42_02652 [Rhizopogon vesiculosus]|uniref:Uncharacterized protein n=1 Tax=Rhizopogon vesiculosus TaxID=180088 RepID=A0A1J8Q4F4_9AGAM|nr:hypothetical protein AZE42_02652 [Rhizopogon vesiculosus]